MTGLLAAILALIRRELITSLRRVRAFVTLSAAVLIASSLVLAAWPRDNASLNQVVQASSTLTMFLSYFLLFAIPAVVTAYGATSITSEREEQTYEMLSLTLIPSWGFVAGKVVNAMGAYVVLLVVSAPIIATQFSLAGVDTGMLWRLLPLLLAIAFSSASISVCASALVRQNRTALLLAYLGVAGIMGLLLALILALLQIIFWDLPISTGQARTLAAIMAPAVSVSMLMSSNQMTMDLLAQAIGFQGSMGLCAFFLAAWQVRRGALPPPVPDATTRPKTAREWIRRFWHGSVPRQAPMPDKANPVYLREMRHGLPTRRSTRRRLFWAGLIVSGLIMGMIGWDRVMGSNRESFLLLMTANFVLVGVIASGLGSSSLTGERESDTFDLLIMTGLPATRIVLGKAVAALRAALPLIFGVWAGVVLAVSIYTVHSIRFAHVAVTLVALLLEACLAISLSILASAIAKRTSIATLLSYILTAWFLVLMFPALVILSELTGGPLALRNAQSTVMWFMCCVSPVLSFYMDLDQSGNYPFSDRWLVWTVANVLVILAVFTLAVGVFRRKVNQRIHGRA